VKEIMEKHRDINPPTFHHHRMVTRDSDEHAESLAKWDQTYDQLSSGAFEGSLVDIWFSGLQMFRETTNRSVWQKGSSWEGSYVIAVPLAMSDTGLISRQLLTPSSIFTFKSESGFDLRTPEQFDVVGIAIPASAFVDFAGPDSEHVVAKFTDHPALLQPPGPKLDELHKFLKSVFHTVTTEPDVLSYSQVQRTMSSSLMEHLFAVLQSAVPAPKAPPSFKSRCHVVDSAVEYALSHLDEPVTVSELCARTKVSRRMLNYCFQDVLDTNPVQYLRALRLNGVRRELRDKCKSALSIRSIACNWGFWHFSRFADEYRSLFGELPSETRKGLHGTTQHPLLPLC
jgi:AraC family ethanolamine operon transcriptional activator